jgi:glucose uptake protein GlcU
MTMTGFIILVVLVLLVIGIYMTLAAIPGDKARERGHPQADAISVLAWIGLLLGLVPWVIALVWAHMTPVFPPANQKNSLE